MDINEQESGSVSSGFGSLKDAIWIQPGYDVDATDPEILAAWDPELEIKS